MGSLQVEICFLLQSMDFRRQKMKSVGVCSLFACCKVALINSYRRKPDNLYHHLCEPQLEMAENLFIFIPNQPFFNSQ